MSEGGSSAWRRRLGVRLRGLRDEAGLTSSQVAAELGWSQSKVSRLETGAANKITIGDITLLLDLYGVRDSDYRQRMITIARESKTRGWWTDYEAWLPEGFETYVALESAANSLRAFDSILVNGLLQTEDYARAVIRAVRIEADAELVEKCVQLRAARQQRLANRSPAPHLWLVMEEAVLRRPLGGPATMRPQLAHLLAVAASPNVTLQVMPTARGVHAGLDGSFAVLGFPDRLDPDVAYVESAAGNTYVERPADVDTYVDRFDHLRATAMAPDDSLATIAAIAKEWA
jgi:transcriptional regulator with XRE-family HTH domain